VSRWRPPAPRSTAVITRAGQRRLGEELDRLWRTTRPEVVRALAAAAAEGDRSENAEYAYRKKQLAEIDRRVRYLGKRLRELRVIEDLPADRDVIRFGAWFVVEDESGTRERQRLVGPDESDHEPGWVSIDAPLARAVLGHRAGDEVEVPLPGGWRRVRIREVRYEEPRSA
jgi:transcription elongation factor GreB